MTARRLALAAVLALAGTLVPGGAASAAGTVPCAAVADCTVVANGDVDGDGIWDEVGLIGPTSATAAPTRYLRVRTSKGVVSTAKVSVPAWSGKIVHGLAPIDGVPGAEVVLGHEAGAHTLYEQVWTWRGSQPTLLRSPSGSSRWVTDSSATVNIGVYRDARNGVVTLRDCVHDGAAHRCVDRRYSADLSGFRQIATKRWTATDSAVSAYGGWHVRYLPRWPQLG